MTLRPIRPSELSQPEQRRGMQQIYDVLKDLDARITALEGGSAYNGAIFGMMDEIDSLRRAVKTDTGHMLTEDDDVLWPEDLSAPFGFEIGSEL